MAPTQLCTPAAQGGADGAKAPRVPTGTVGICPAQPWRPPFLYPGFFLTPRHPDTPRDITAIWAWHQRPLVATPGLSCRVWPSRMYSSPVSLYPIEFRSRVPPWMLRPNPAAEERMTPSWWWYPPTESQHQLCPQGAPVPGCPFTKIPPMTQSI